MPRLHRFAPLVAARFVRRRNRFLADMALADGSLCVAHCPNTGSMRGLLVPGASAMLSSSPRPGRKTQFTWEQVRIGRTWVAVNTMLTNHLVERILRMGLLGDVLPATGVIRREVTVEHSRIDFVLEGAGSPLWLEVKSSTMCNRGRAAFPDAVTRRGLKHLECLMKRVALGERGAVLFLAQRGDARFFEAARETDPAYAEALEAARAAGVKVIAAVVRVNPGGVFWKGIIPVK